MTVKPKVSNSLAEQELDKAGKQLDAFEANVKTLTQDRMNEMSKKPDRHEPELSQKEIAKSKDIYLKPKRTISSREKFNEDFRKEYEFAREYVQFMAENKEVIGESIEMWTKPFAGLPAEEWVVPTNKPVWGPRYLAEQIKRKYYHRLTMAQNQSTGSDGMGQYFGTMVADTTVQRLDAHPVSQKKSMFTGAANF